MFKINSSLFLLITFLLLSVNSFAQFYFIEDQLDQIEVDFLRKKIETKTDETFFNVLKISNPTSKILTFDTKFSYPAGWSFMGEKNQQITLNPSDSILIPFRGAPSKNAKGEIGYAIVASLSDLKGNSIKNEYSFVNIPKKTNLKFQLEDRVVYFDQLNDKSAIGVSFINEGNIDEIVYLNLNLSSGITIEGAQNNIYTKEFSIKSSSDTTYYIPIELNSNYKITEKKFHRLQLSVNTADTTFKTSIWAKELEANFSNEIPYSYKMINFELITQNLFSESAAYNNFHLYGNFLPKKNVSFSYDYQTFGFSNNTSDLWIKSRMIINIVSKKLLVQLGDIPQIMGHNLYGRGGFVEYNPNNKNTIKFGGSTTIVNSNYRGALSYKRKFKSKNSLELGTSYENNININASSHIGFGTVNIATNKVGRFSLYGAYSQAKWDYSNNTQSGFATGAIYQLQDKKLNVFIRGRYANPKYFGYYSGRGEVNGQVRYTLSQNKYISVDGNYNSSQPSSYIGDSIVYSNLNSYGRARATYNLYAGNGIFLSMGPLFENKEGNNFFGNQDAYLKTSSGLGYFSFRFTNPVSRNVFSGTATAGVTFPTSARIEGGNIDNLKQYWFNSVLSLSYRARLWGFSGSYYHGPYFINQQYSYFTTGYFSKNIRLMPYLDVFIFPKYLKFATRPNIVYDIPAKTTRLNATSEIVAYPGRNWEIIFSNTYGYSLEKDLLTEEKNSYNSSYFELRLRKSFDFNQPRYQYHNLKLNFFKDLNGNKVRDKDEPGIRDVFAFIQQDEREYESDNPGAAYFLPMELLSDINGEIEYENIPNGFYTIDFKPMGKMEGAFTSETNNIQVYIDNSKVLNIPFVENNKIFGKVMLNRSKLSNLGTIDPANIKVTAEDSRGKKYSTLTDANGNFTIFVPNVDVYKVRVNNIFYENFELEQNDYEVQLNGYRQFEVNFIFNEKRRKIRFSSSYEYGSTSDAPGIEIIRRTNLNGTVKDATTLKPLVANIKIVDKNGSEITTARSNLSTGIFATSFVAGDDYYLEVNAEDYWFYAEKLYSQQIVTFKNLKKDVLLRGITVGSLIPMRTLKYESGSSDIPLTSFPELERLLKVLRQNPTVKITVHGHADDMEILDSSEDLALERAKLVAKYLIANGYNRVKYVGHSNTKPIADNDTETGRKENRRVEIVVTGK